MPPEAKLIPSKGLINDLKPNAKINAEIIIAIKANVVSKTFFNFKWLNI